MLSAQVVQDINNHLTAGNVAAALAPLTQAVDVRWNELPKLEKKTLTAFAQHLREREAPAEQIADAAFHSNVSVRRFVRKLAQVLKADATLLAKPLRARLEKYLREAKPLPWWSANHEESARRHEQLELLESMIDLLRRCDLDEFMDCFGALLKQWRPLQEKQKQQQEQWWAQMASYQKEYEHKLKEVVEELYAHLDMPQEELMQVPRFMQEIQEKLTGALESPENPWLQMQTATTSLMDAMHIVPQSFFKAIESILGYRAKPSAEQERVRAHVWRWVEDGLRDDDSPALPLSDMMNWQWMNWLGRQPLRERALPLLTEAKAAGRADSALWRWLVHILCDDLMRHLSLESQEEFSLPPSFTPDTVRALKRGSAQDKMLEDALRQHGRLEFVGRDTEQNDLKLEALAQMLEEQMAGRAPKVEPEEVTAIASVPFPYSHSQTDATQFRTVEERVAALCEPPTVQPVLGIVGMYPKVPRIHLLQQWQSEAGWEQQVSAIREQALPKLWEKLREQCDAFRATRKRNAPDPQPLSEAAAAALTEREREQLQRSARQMQQWNAQQQVDDIVRSIMLLGGTDVYPQLLDALEDKGLADLQNNAVYYMITLISQHDSPDPALLPFLRNVQSRWKRNHSGRHRAHQIWHQQLINAPMMTALYKNGTPEAVAEARAFVETDTQSYWGHPLSSLVRERRDYDMMLSLIRNLAQKDDNLLALWDDLRTTQPDRVPEFVAAVLTTLSETTEADRARMPIAMLERIEKQTDLFAPHFDILAQCVESTLPVVVRFALSQLAKMPDADGDWTTLCERAGEKLWSENAGLAKDAAKFLGQVGARNADAAPVAFAALSDALSLNNLPMLETLLRALGQIRGKQGLQLNEAARKRIEQLRDEQPMRLGKLCERVLTNTGG